MNPDGKAMIKAAEYVALPEQPDEEFPFHLSTGRTLVHFHTRTKTGRSPELNKAEPEVWVEMSASDAGANAVVEGDLVDICSPR